MRVKDTWGDCQAAFVSRILLPSLLNAKTSRFGTCFLSNN